MRRIGKFIGYLFLILLSIPVVIILLLSARYSPKYVYRLARFNVADVYDYNHFENRVIRASEKAFSFTADHDEDYTESLFRDAVESYGFNSLEEWAEGSQTTALIVIRRDTILYEKYFNGFGRDSYFHSQSMAKSFISLLMMQSGLKYNLSYLPGINIHAPWHDEAVGYYHGNVRKLLLKQLQY